MKLRWPWRVFVFMLAGIAACAELGGDANLPRGSTALDAATPVHDHAADEVAYYTCSMHTSVRSETPGKCPICGMELVAVSREEVETGVIIVDAQRRQSIGVTTEAVARRPLTRTVRAVGRVAYDETGLVDVSLKVRGWIGEIFVDAPGMRVRRGDPLFTLYSPELFAAQEELVAAAASQRAALSGGAPGRADYLVTAARRRLRLWDIGEDQVERALRAGKALEYVPITSPASGYVIEKNVVQGAAIEPGMRLYRIADLDRVWLEADLYESDLALVKVGDPVRIHLPYAPESSLEGRVAFLYPYLDEVPRTGRARIDLANPGLALKPAMYADVTIDKALGERLAVPEDAILYAGERSFVFVDLGEGRLKPRQVRTGQVAGDWVEILDGIDEGERVVTSGNFLIAAESRLKLDMEHWR